MEYTNIYDMGWDIGITFVVFTGYIVGKVWMYYRIENPTNKENKKSNKRNREWVRKDKDILTLLLIYILILIWVININN